jgi:hypothetical protein
MNTSTAHRVKLSRAKGWTMPPNTVKVDRTTRWGNPYALEYAYGAWKVVGPGGRVYGVWDYKPAAVRKAIELFVASLNDEECSAIRADLAGKNLACWCPLDGPCHADALLQIANGGAA